MSCGMSYILSYILSYVISYVIFYSLMHSNKKKDTVQRQFLSPIPLISIYPIEDSKFLEQNARLFLQMFDIKPYLLGESINSIRYFSFSH